jgi:hypothetical protein
MTDNDFLGGREVKMAQQVNKEATSDKTILEFLSERYESVTIGVTMRSRKHLAGIGQVYQHR